MDIACGTYNLTGTFNSGYEFSSWSKSGSGSITNTGTLSTTYTVNGTGSITLNGKNISTPTGYMQDFTLGQCQYYANSSNYTLRDRRDNNTYTVRYINGNCWMTQNLRLSGGRTLTTSDSNVTSNWYFPSTQLAGASDSYTESQMTISSNASYGGYYNYCAASAGTICKNTYSETTQDICPKSWRLPTRSELDGITSYIYTFLPISSGAYYSGSFYSPVGVWWSATASDPAARYYLIYKDSTLSTSFGYKTYGHSVRCIRSS